MKRLGLLPGLAAVSLLATGCGVRDQTGTADPAPASQSSNGMSQMHMSAKEMAAMNGPSHAASMICSDEIASTVRHTFALTHRPEPTRSWYVNDLLFSCTYPLPGGDLRMSVHDAVDARTGRAYFERLRARLPAATAIRGVPGLGLPAIQTANGNVAFLKDGKTLRVDASHLSRGDLPGGMTREEVSYGVAAAVVTCWSK